MFIYILYIYLIISDFDIYIYRIIPVHHIQYTKDITVPH